MKMVSVVPISKGIPKETLNYFSKDDVGAGDLIQVPMRGRIITARVSAVVDVKDAKAEIKSMPFTMRKIVKVEAPSFCRPEFMEAVSETALYFAGTTGAVLHSLIPPTYLLKKISKGGQKENLSSGSKSYSEKMVLQADEEERFSHFKGIIREEFAKKKSIYICFPVAEMAKRAGSVLSRGLEDYVIVLHGGQSKKKLAEEWEKALSLSHPVLVVGTSQYIGIPRGDFGTIIIENESSRFYKNFSRPFVDFRVFAEILAERSGARLIFSDTMLRVETIWRQKFGELAEYAPLKFRSLSSAEVSIVDVSVKDAEERVLSPEVVEILKSCRDKDENLFVLVPRRGLHPYTFCRDCGDVVKCEECGAPISIHKVRGAGNLPTVFFCHRCGFNKETDARCEGCGSWNLLPIGVGIEFVERSVSEAFPDMPLFRVDKDLSSSPASANKIVEKFTASPGGVLLGTETVLSYLSAKIENVVLIYPESFLALPNFRVSEEILHLVLRSKALANKRFVVQMLRQNEIINLASVGNLSEFYRREIAEREKYGYPPFKVFVKVTRRGKPEAVVKDMELFEQTFHDWSPAIFGDFVEKKKGLQVSHALIKVDRKEWPNRTLLEKLLALPAGYSVDVEPESIL